MKRIQFNEETIDAIRSFMTEGHSVPEACNKFNIKYDTMRRVLYDNNIEFRRARKAIGHDRLTVSQEDIDLVCKLYSTTDIRVADLCKAVKLEDYNVQKILAEHFSEEYRNARKSRIYRKSKLGDKNPMTGLSGSQTPNWKGGVIDDGNGYLMVKKPDWYTGRKGSDYVFQHSVVMCEALGLTEIPKGFVVHHIDRNKHNNSIHNLCLLSSNAHSQLHSIESKMCKVQRLSDME